MKKLDEKEKEFLYTRALDLIDKSSFTRTIRQKIEVMPDLQDFAKSHCFDLYKLCNCDLNMFDQAMQEFIEFSKEFLTLQLELNKTGKYKFDSYHEARKKIYDNPEVMGKHYLNGLFISQAFWINHYKILKFYLKRFCGNLPAYGEAMEVPVGTGIYLAGFEKINPGWKATGYDISKTSCQYSKRVIDMYNLKSEIYQKDVFLIENAQYDRIICGELIEHLEDPESLLVKIKSLLKKDGKIFLTTAIWAAAIDHIYLFKSAEEVRVMLKKYYNIEEELVLPVFKNKTAESEKTPINYACILSIKNN